MNRLDSAINVSRVLRFDESTHELHAADRWERFLSHEWLVTNGLGGYSSGTVAGVDTRRFHGLLIAALPLPHGRTMMLNHVAESLSIASTGNEHIDLGGEESPDQPVNLSTAEHLVEFRLDYGLPVWVYEIGEVRIEKRILLLHLQNTVHVNYTLARGEGSVRLRLRPAVHFRPHEGPVGGPVGDDYTFKADNSIYEIHDGSELPPLRISLYGQNCSFKLETKRTADHRYRVEQSRGYDYRGELWTPGFFSIEIGRGKDATLVSSTEDWEIVRDMEPAYAQAAELERRWRLLERAAPAARKGFAAELVFAADQFIIKPAGRVRDTARANAIGDEVRTVIAGYHWFTDWGRDTMISLEGLTLVTGRYVEAAYILRTFAHYVRDGLIPNMFPEGRSKGLYHTADATLWFFHALHRYLSVTRDHLTLKLLLPKMEEIVKCHLNGTRFGICVDEQDGLLKQGAPGFQLTWMDAKAEDWVVTPRRGKAVEINALWYNALRLLEKWLRLENRDADARQIRRHADRALKNFNRRFWYAGGGHLYDIVDGENGDDAACRPNQIFAIALDYPVLARNRWEPVLKVIREKLATPVGLRTLAPDHPDFKRHYDGDLRARDAAYHQGTVWAWLCGPMVDAWLKTYPGDVDTTREFIAGFKSHLNEACVGSIAEIFDADAPFTPRGCIAQAWSVAEVLRSLIRIESLSQKGQSKQTEPEEVSA